MRSRSASSCCKASVRFSTSARNIRFHRYRTANESRTIVKPAPAPIQKVASGPSISRNTSAEAEPLSTAISATASPDAAPHCIRLVKVRDPLSVLSCACRHVGGENTERNRRRLRQRSQIACSPRAGRTDMSKFLERLGKQAQPLNLEASKEAHGHCRRSWEKGPA